MLRYCVADHLKQVIKQCALTFDSNWNSSEKDPLFTISNGNCQRYCLKIDCKEIQI